MAGSHFFVEPCEKGGWVYIMSYKRIYVLLVAYWWGQRANRSQLQRLRWFQNKNVPTLAGVWIDCQNVS